MSRIATSSSAKEPIAARRRQLGAALLAAMLTVSLVATFAAAALWQQWRSTEVETAERARVQSEWVLTGALDWARLLLREDAKAGGADHLGEPWAVPLQEARLSSFLAAERNTMTVNDAPVFDAFLSGQIIDLQSLLNVNNLVDVTGKVSEKGVRTFARLFELMGLPPAQLDRLVENLRFATDNSANNRNSAAAPLVPQHVEQLVWLGLPVQTVAVLQPYVTVLPVHDTPVNLNTASAEVIYAAVDGLSLADAQRLVTDREAAPYRSVADAKKRIGATDAMFAEGQAPVNISSRFFEVRARLRLESLVVEQRSMLQRDGVEVKTLESLRGIPDLSTLAQQAPMR